MLTLAPFVVCRIDYSSSDDDDDDESEVEAASSERASLPSDTLSTATSAMTTTTTTTTTTKAKKEESPLSSSSSDDDDDDDEKSGQHRQQQQLQLQEQQHQQAQQHDDDAWASWSKDELLALCKKKSEQVAQGKQTIAMLIEQITDYQLLMEQEKEALAKDLRLERAARDELDARCRELQDDLDAEQHASRQQSQDTMNNLRTLMMELENIEEANAALSQKLVDEREAHQAALRAIQLERDAAAAASAAVATVVAAASAAPTPAPLATPTSTPPPAAGDRERRSRSDSTATADESSSTVDPVSASLTGAIAKAGSRTKKTERPNAHLSISEGPMRRESGGKDPKPTIKRVSQGGVDSDDDGESLEESDPHDKIKRRSSKPNPSSSSSSTARGSAHTRDSRSKPATSTTTAAAAAATGATTTSAATAGQPPSSASSPPGSRRTSPTRGSNVVRRRHRTDEVGALQLDGVGDGGNLATDEGPADADEATQMRRTIAYLTHQLTALRDIVGDALDAASQSGAAARPLVTPRMRSTRRQPSGSAAHTGTSPFSRSSAPAAGGGAASGAPLDAGRSALRELRGRLEEQIKLESVRSRRSRGGDSTPAPTVPPSPRLTKDKSTKDVGALAKETAAAAALSSTASSAQLVVPVAAASNKNAPNVKATRERVFAAPDGVTAMCIFEGNVWAGCEDGSIVVFNSKTRARVAHIVAYVSFDHNGGADKAQAARSLPLGAAPPPSTIQTVMLRTSGGVSAADKIDALVAASAGGAAAAGGIGANVAAAAAAAATATPTASAAGAGAGGAASAAPSALRPLLTTVQSFAVVGETMWVAYRDGSVVVFHSTQYKQLHVVPAGSRVTRLLAVESGFVWGLTVDMKILVWRAGSYRLLKAIERNNFCQACCYAGGMVWIGTERQILRYDVHNRKLIDELNGHEKMVECMVCVGDAVWSSSSDAKINVWNVQSGALLQTFELQTRGIGMVSVNDQFVWLSCRDQRVAVFDAASREFLQYLVGLHKDVISCMVAVPNSTKEKWSVWTGSADKSLGVWPTQFANKTKPKLLSASQNVPGLVRWVSSVRPNEHEWQAWPPLEGEPGHGAAAAANLDCVVCSGEVECSATMRHARCKKCGVMCHLECQSIVPDSCGVDAAKAMTMRTLYSKSDASESDIFQGLLDAFTSPQHLEAGRIIIAHAVSTKGAKAAGEFAQISARWPLAKREFSAWEESKSLEKHDFHLGNFQLVEVELDIWVANVLVHDGQKVQPKALRFALWNLMLHAIKTDALVHMARRGWGVDDAALEQMLNELPALRVWLHSARQTSVSSLAGGKQRGSRFLSKLRGDGTK